MDHPDQQGSAIDALRSLHWSGRLAEEYPRVAGLLRDMPEADLVRAGQVLARVPAEAVLRAHPQTPAVRVAITGHAELSGLLPPLAAQLARHGLLLVPYQAPFDSYVTQLADPGSGLYAHEPDLTLCVLDATVVLDDLPAPWLLADAERAVAERVGVIERLAETFTRTCAGVLVLNTMPLPYRWSAQLVDHRSRAALGAVWREGNASLLRLSARYATVTVLDLDPLLADGVPAGDQRMSAYARAHLGGELLARYARQVGHLARHVTGRARKVLAVDLDNTLWGGILGEDGAHGIEVGGGYRGGAFQTFQRVVKQLSAQGVLVAVVSKNDVEPVQQVLREHPEMVVREEDLVRVVANWRPKHENLTELATALNLGTDSLVFADDSGYECGLVRHELPEVAVVQLDDEPALHVEKLLADGWFEVRDLTPDDRARTASYRSELERRSFLDHFESVEDYLRELGIAVRLARVREPDVPRVAQLTLRTNQFNLTTVRMQPAEVGALLADPESLVLGIRESDRFGDNGLVGAVFARWRDGALHLENVLLSCRVFGRGIEDACLCAILRYARAAGAWAVVGHYRKTPKNGLVADLYSRYGFTPAMSEPAGTAVFRHDLGDIAAPPEYVRLTEDF